MYTIITINLAKQDPTELGIWTNELKEKHWHLSEHTPGTCWKKFAESDPNAYKKEFDEAIVTADLVKDYFVISYSEHAPSVQTF